MHSFCSSPSAVVKPQIHSVSSIKRREGRRRRRRLENRSWVLPRYRAVILLTWEDTGNELLSLLHVESFCWRVNPKQFQILRNTGAAGVPTAVLELAVYALQPYLLCTWAASIAAPLTREHRPPRRMRDRQHVLRRKEKPWPAPFQHVFPLSFY